MYHFKKVLLIGSLGVFLFNSYGCAVHGVKAEKGNPIDEKKISQIVRGKTTATEIIGMFGAPTNTSTAANMDYFIYQNCKTGGSGFTVMGIGHTGTKEKCNALTIIIDKNKGVVADYNYQKQFDAE